VFDFLERQDILAGLELHPFFGHAVKTPDVAAIGHADPQIVVYAAEAVEKRFHAVPLLL
jgi:hypothetical protein